MYDAAYHLNSDPFRLSPDHRFCFRHKSYARNKAYLDYALQRAEGFVMITGSPGTGKTTLLNDVLADIDKTNIVVARIVTTQLTAEDLLRMVAFSFRLKIEDMSKATILQRLENFFTQLHHYQRRPLLVIDEAQDLDPTALEEMRLLTNMQSNNRPLLQVFLVGQENLLEMIEDPRMEQLHQRFIATSHLEPMNVSETASYVIHRLRLSGWNKDPMISNGALRRIHIFSRGIPRRVNQICSRVLLYGAVENKHTLTSKDIQEVIKELSQEHLAPQEPGELIEAIPDEDISFSEIDAYENVYSMPKRASVNPVPEYTRPVELKPITPQEPETNVEPVAEASEGIPRPEQDRVSSTLVQQNPLVPEAPAVNTNLPIARFDNIAQEFGRIAMSVKQICLVLLQQIQPHAQKAWLLLGKKSEQRFFAATGLILILILASAILTPQEEPQAQTPPALPKEVAEQQQRPVDDTSVASVSTPIEVPLPKQAQEQKATLEQEPVPETEQPSLEKTLSEQGLNFVKLAPGIYKLSLNVDSLFARGSAIMPSALQSSLTALASIARQDDTTIVHIIGHCDSTGSEKRNLVLSELRAQVVTQYLALQGIPLHRLTAEGRGSKEPISETNPYLNRRVDLYIERLPRVATPPAEIS